MKGIEGNVPMTFIRAPYIKEVWGDAEVLAASRLHPEMKLISLADETASWAHEAILQSILGYIAKYLKIHEQVS